MRIIIGGKEVKLIPRDVQIARKLVTDFMDSVEKHANGKKAPGLFFTVLIIMHLKSQDAIKAITPKTMSVILNATETSYKRNNKNEINKNDLGE